MNKSTTLLLLLPLFLGSAAALSGLKEPSTHEAERAMSTVFTVDDFGAVPGVNTLTVATSNGAAFTAALQAAHDAGAGTVVVPAGGTYYAMPFGGTGHVEVTLVVDGQVLACDLLACIRDWPLDGGKYQTFFAWDAGTGLTLSGAGALDGQGYVWWWLFLLGRLGSAKRPSLTYHTLGANFTMRDLELKNSAIMHCHLDNHTDATIDNVTIWVDWRAQVQLSASWAAAEAAREFSLGDGNESAAVVAAVASTARKTAERLRFALLPKSPSDKEIEEWASERKGKVLRGETPRFAELSVEEATELRDRWVLPGFESGDQHIDGDQHINGDKGSAARPSLTGGSRLHGRVPMLPFNTDGIDPGTGSSRVRMRRLTVENFDDVVAIKPCNGACANLGKSVCTEDILIEDSVIYLGVGLSVGSVNPKTPTNCIRGVVVRRATFLWPFKAIYVKTNSGDEGDGIIKNVTYSDIFIKNPFYVPIYIGPQQQKEPSGVGDGVWPPTQPRITLKGITLRNVTSVGGPAGGAFLLPHAGVLRCNESNPCTDFVLERVFVESQQTQQQQLEAEAHQGSAVGSTAVAAAASRHSSSSRLVGDIPVDPDPYVCSSVIGAVDAKSTPQPTPGHSGSCTWA